MNLGVTKEQEEKGMTKDEMVGWHHRVNGHGFGWTLGVGDGQGGLACCDSWGCKELDTTDRLNLTERFDRLKGKSESPLGFSKDFVFTYQVLYL